MGASLNCAHKWYALASVERIGVRAKSNKTMLKVGRESAKHPFWFRIAKHETDRSHFATLSLLVDVFVYVH